MKISVKIILVVILVLGLITYLEYQKKQNYDLQPEDTVGATGTVGSRISPDGKYEVDVIPDGFVSCCGGENNVQNSQIWLRDLRSGEKFLVQRPNAKGLGARILIRFNGWYSDSSGIMVYFQAPDEVTQGSDIYKVDLTGKIIGIDKTQNLPEIY